ncbi:saccharopine dehydrogenase NADP-binding domain-containing protein [Photobacterium sanguinicancri]|uniref:saccharopine dehydrogenase NADP-binding domain-containing protein n=1 Tax=Photobacterium sanguinicancri TaxID=875932 RepID=UPI003D125FAC
MSTNIPNPKILILGGFGRVGMAAAQYLLSLTDVTLTLASRHPKRLPIPLSTSESSQITVLKLDIKNVEALQEACRQHDLVISCVGPSGLIGNTVAQTCKEVETPLIDAGGYDPLLSSLEADEFTQPTHVPLIINVGLLPGLSGLYPQHLINTLLSEHTITGIDIYYVGRDNWSYNSAWDIISSLGDFGKDHGFCYLENNQLKRQSFFKASKKVRFPAPIGTASTMLIYSEEIIRLARQNNISNVNVYGANIGPRAALICAIAKIFGLYRTEKGIARGARWLVKASQKDMQKLQPTYGIKVDVHDKSGDTTSSELLLSDTYQATGTIIGITAKAVINGRHNGPGVFMLHEAIKHPDFMTELAQSGVITYPATTFHQPSPQEASAS